MNRTAGPFAYLEPAKWRELTDQAGHRWTPREMFALRRRSFVARYDGNYRTALSLYGLVAWEAKREEAARLSPVERDAYRELDRVHRRLVRAGCRLIYESDEMGVGTVVLAAVMGIEADREDTMRRCAIHWRAPAGSVGRAWLQAKGKLRDELPSHPSLPARSDGPPRSRAVYKTERQTLLHAWATLERMRPRLSGYVEAEVVRSVTELTGYLGFDR